MFTVSIVLYNTSKAEVNMVLGCILNATIDLVAALKQGIECARGVFGGTARNRRMKK